MNYELALELKNAGFPFTPLPEFTAPKPLDRYGKGIHFGEGILYAVPTLEKLIEACRLFNHDYDILVESLRDDRYYAGARLFGYTEANANGQTATEAVAMLYLALYGNKQNTKKGSETSCVEGK